LRFVTLVFGVAKDRFGQSTAACSRQIRWCNQLTASNRTALK
jgi:hypothetical protein